MKDLSTHNKDYARFLPAISSFYTGMLDSCRNGRYTVPEAFENGVDSLNFLDHEKGAFFYNNALYSAGHAQLDLDKCFNPSSPIDQMIHSRDKTRTTLIGDSGGYQMGKGGLNFDWSRFYEKKGDAGYVGNADKVRTTILHWLESTSDWSMVLDVPSWAASMDGRKITGMRNFQDCLDATNHNNRFFLENRLGVTKFLNVLQGSNWEEAQIWYDSVKDYEFEGWGMGGNTVRDMNMLLKRLIVMRDEGKLEGKDWMHFLGTSRLDWAVMFTILQRQVRKHINPNISFSFDCASPFIATANGLTYTSPVHTPARFSYIMETAPDNKMLKGSDIPYPFDSEIGQRLTIGDLCQRGPGENLDTKGIERKTSWDSLSYAMIMAHNVYQHVRSVQVANQLTAIEIARYAPDISQWKKLKKSTKSAEFSRWVPRNLLFFNQFVDDLFASHKPMQMLEDNRAFLEAIRGPAGHGGINNHVFGQLFDHSVQSREDEGFSPEEEDKLAVLENRIL